MNYKLLLVSLFAFVSECAASDSLNLQIKPRKWYFNESFGISFESGNVNDLKLKNSGWVERDDSVADFECSYKFVYAMSEHEETNKELKAFAKLDFLQYDRWSPFTALEFLTNRYKGYDSKFSVLAGVKRCIYRKKHVNNYSISLAFVYDNVDYTPTESLMDNHEYRLSLRPKIKQKFNSTVSLTFFMFYQPSVRNFSDYLLSAQVGLECCLHKSFYLDFCVSDDYSSRIPTIDYIHNDFQTELSIKYKY